MTQPTIVLSPRKVAISTQGGPMKVLVRVQTPDQQADAKTKVGPKRLALVVDRSGSMQGQPLTEALRCVMLSANCVTPADQLNALRLTA